MRQRCFLPLLALVLVIGSPAAAVAGDGGWWWWLDSLSGPGEFRGLFLQHNVRTWQKKVLADPDSPTSFFDPSGLEIDWNRRYVRLQVQGGFLLAERNNLQYAPPLDQAPPDVHAIPVMASIDVGGLKQLKSLEFGAGVGWVRFSAGDAAFWRFAVEPHIIWRPLVLGDDLGNRRGLIEVRLFGVGILQEIGAGDFGAVGGMEESREWLFPGIMITVNPFGIKR